jgi:hypothetical protein
VPTDRGSGPPGSHVACRRPSGGLGRQQRSSGLLHVEVSLARVSQSGMKTSGDTMAGGACGTITDVALEAS